jgi:hypothetical protein
MPRQEAMLEEAIRQQMARLQVNVQNLQEQLVAIPLYLKISHHCHHL